MGILHVSRTERTTEEDVPVTNVIAESTDGDPQTLELVQPPGVDAPPLPGDVAITATGGTTGTEQAVGFVDPKNAGKAEDGEVRMYGRSPDGSIVNEFWLKGDGTIRCSNNGGYFELSPGGDLTVSGAVKANGEVTAMAQAAPVNLSTHLTPSPFGPVGPPTPGT